jgi:predicted nucleic acid-binding protein
MRLIVDSNEIISALIKEGMTRTIITSDRIELCAMLEAAKLLGMKYTNTPLPKV